MATSRTYTKSTSFSDGANPKQLRELVADDSGITTQFAVVDAVVSDDDLDQVVFNFQADLSAGEEAALDALVAAYVFAESVQKDEVGLSSDKPNTVELNEYSPGKHNYRNWKIPILQVPAGSEEAEVTFKLPIEIGFLRIEYSVDQAQVKKGDNISAIVYENMDMDVVLQAMGMPAGVGLLKAAAAVDDLEIVVDPLLITESSVGARDEILRPGYGIRLAADTNVEYLITGYDKLNNKVLLARRQGPSNYYNAGVIEGLDQAHAVNDKLFRTVWLGDEVWIHPLTTNDAVEYGSSKVGASRLPAGTPITLRYKKPGDTAVARDVYINLETLY